jgi:putative CocE/NonD family hydrolase
MLSRDPPTQGEPDHYVYDPRDVSLADLESTVDPEDCTDQRMVHAQLGKQLIYHTAPLEEDLEVSGFFKCSLWLAIDQPDTDIRISVYELSLDGASIRLTADWVRARYRTSLREEALIRTQEPLRYDFERFTFISRRLRAGHRLRLVIGPINSIYSQKNYNSGGVVSEESTKDARPVTVRLFHDPAHPSALDVPIGQPDS